MKLITAIVNSDDSSRVLHHLTQHGYSVTKMATTGGFLKIGSTTFLIGVEDEQVDGVIDILRKYSSRNEVYAPVANAGAIGVPTTVKVNYGGATVFVTDVERFEKL